MILSDNILIGPSIAYRSEDILDSLRKQEPFGYPVWYAVTTAVEEENLMYILSGLEMRNTFYLKSNLRLLGIAGSREEAGNIVLKLVQTGYNKGEILSMKQYLEHRGDGCMGGRI